MIRKRDFRMRVALEFQKPDGLTKQSMRDECDINKLMSKYQKTGLMSHLARFQGRYEDVTGAVDYRTALDIVRSAQDMFMTLPSNVRAQFSNDPGEFLHFASNPANAGKLVELGLAKPILPELPDAPREPTPVEAPAPAKDQTKG